MAKPSFNLSHYFLGFVRKRNKNTPGAFGKRKPTHPFNGKVIPRSKREVGVNCNDLGIAI